ncbi:MAG: sodium:proton antiporter [Clostridiales bacterium]|nr:sodium:proton antiporter [Clostridiales bacterium]
MMIAVLLLLPLLGAVAAPLLGKKNPALRDAAVQLFTLAQLALAVWLFCLICNGKEASLFLPGLCGMNLSFRADGFRGLYAMVAAFMWAMATQFSKQYFNHGENHGRYACFTMITLCGVMGVFFSNDLYTTFVFFEIMSIASYPWVAHEENKEAMRAAATYLGVSIACGMVTLMGMFLAYQEMGDLSFAALRAQQGNEKLVLPACLMLVGYCAKAGLAPLHIWLPKAHPVAPAPASALLSGMLTKTGLFGVIAIGLTLMGENTVFGQVMLVLGLFTMLLGAVLAVFSVNLKRTLACSSLSQIGYITVGLSCAVLLGHHGSLAAAGAVGHMVNHSLLKLLLFLVAGAVYMNAHTLDLTKLQGFGRGKPLLHGLFLLGGLGLAGVPMFNGYASKTMIHEGMVELIHEHYIFAYQIAEWVFLFAAGLTTAYMLKLYICLFWQKNLDEKLQEKYDGMKGRYLSKRSAISLVLSAIPVLLLGLFPNQLLMPLTRLSASFLGHHEHGDVAFLAWVNLKGGGVSLIIGVLVYVLFVRKALMKKGEGYLNLWPRWLDLEELFYRPVCCRFLPWLGCTVASFLDHLPAGKAVTKVIPAILVGVGRVFDEMVDHILLITRELFLVNRQSLLKARSHNIFTRLAAAVEELFYHVMHPLLPKRFRAHKSPTDMRYGSYATNAISFGLLLCALGIVATLIYVFIRVNN